MKNIRFAYSILILLATVSLGCVRTGWTSEPVSSWQPVDQELADALAEGEAPDATTRDWEACEWHDHTNTGERHVRCPDGYEQID